MKLRYGPMDAPAQFNTILELAERLGILVRMERLGGAGGGLCTVRGTRTLFVDLDADVLTRLERSLRALAQIPEVDGVYLAPWLREALDRARDSP